MQNKWPLLQPAIVELDWALFLLMVLFTLSQASRPA